MPKHTTLFHTFLHRLHTTYGGRALTPTECLQERNWMLTVCAGDLIPRPEASTLATKAIAEYDNAYCADTPDALRSGCFGTPREASQSFDGRRTPTYMLAFRIQTKLDAAMADNPDADPRAVLFRIRSAYIKHRKANGERADSAARRWKAAIVRVSVR
jgi:hypothetical protein